jgi:hypothetical protein
MARRRRGDRATIARLFDLFTFTPPRTGTPAGQTASRTKSGKQTAARPAARPLAAMPTFDGLGIDVQDCIVASMNVTTILTYSTSSRSAQSAVNRWKVRIATLAGLGGVVPSGARIRDAILAVQHAEQLDLQYMYRLRDLPADIMDFLAMCGIKHFDAKADFVIEYSMPSQSQPSLDNIKYSMPAPRLESTIMQLAVQKSAGRIEATIVRLLKSAHAAGRGCGRRWIPTSRRAIIEHVHAFPSLTAPWNFGLRPTEAFILHRIQNLMDRKYAVVDEKDDELLYYFPR